MKTLHNYLTRQVLASLFMTVAVFTFVLLIGNALQQILKLLVSGHATLGTVVEAIGLLIPFVWVFALPMGLLTAMLLVFGRFSADQELTAVRASGISLISLIMPVLFLSLLCCGVSAWINMELGPQCRVAYNDLFFKLKGELLNAEIPEGQFVRDFPGFIFYTKKNNGGELSDVMVFKLDTSGTNVITTVSAPRGRIEKDVPNKQLILHLFDARSVSTGNSATNGVTIESSPDAYCPLNSTGTTNKVFKPKISDMTFWQLRAELADLEKKLSLPPPAATNSVQLRAQMAEARKDRKDFTEPVRVEMNRQIAFSFACFGFTLVGIPLGIRVHRRETNIGVAIPNFIFQAVGVVLLWRANKGI